MVIKKSFGKAMLIIALALTTIISARSSSMEPILQYIRDGFFVDWELGELKKESPIATVPGEISSIYCDVLVVGGGTSGISAAIQSARDGARTCLIEETDWIGGMLTSAGVSSLDGGNENYTGITREFVSHVWNKYNDNPTQTKKCLAPFCYEPHVGHEVLQEMAKREKNLQLFLNTKLLQIVKINDRISGIIAKTSNNKSVFFEANVTIEATEFGDVLYLGNVPHDLDTHTEEREKVITRESSCIQPITMVAVLEDIGRKATPIPMPANYDPSRYQCFISSNPKCQGKSKFPNWEFFVKYGQLPNNKVMVNVPLDSYGNGIRIDDTALELKSRAEITEMARQHTLGFVYYIQTSLGKTNYVLANEFANSGGIAVIPYVRESRRVKGIVRITGDDVGAVNDDEETRFWPDSIAIGDYPLDIHSCGSGEKDTYMSLPSFQVPYAALIPRQTDGLLVAEKSISVSHIANGRTRLQPIVMSIGQAAGAAAALAVKHNIEPRNVSILELQRTLVKAGSRINYYSDLSPEHWAFEAASILKQKRIMNGYGRGIFRPESGITGSDLATILNRISNQMKISTTNINAAPQKHISRGEFIHLLASYLNIIPPDNDSVSRFKDIDHSHPLYQAVTALARNGIIKGENGNINLDREISRAEVAVAIYQTLLYLEKNTTAS